MWHTDVRMAKDFTNALFDRKKKNQKQNKSNSSRNCIKFLLLLETLVSKNEKQTQTVSAPCCAHSHITPVSEAKSMCVWEMMQIKYLKMHVKCI